MAVGGDVFVDGGDKALILLNKAILIILYFFDTDDF